MVTEPALSWTTLASSRIGAMASEASEHSSPTTMCGLSWSSTRFTVLVACSGLHAESSYCTCSLVPLTFDLSCSRARSMPSLPITPKYEPGPEIGISTPMRITRSWASAPNAMTDSSVATAVLISFMGSPSSRRCADCTTRPPSEGKALHISGEGSTRKRYEEVRVGHRKVEGHAALEPRDQPGDQVPVERVQLERLGAMDALALEAAQQRRRRLVRVHGHPRGGLGRFV